MRIKRDHFNTHHCVVRACLVSKIIMYIMYILPMFLYARRTFKGNRSNLLSIAYTALHRRVQVMLIRVRKIQVGHDTCPAYAGVSSLGVPGGTSRFWQIS